MVKDAQLVFGDPFTLSHLHPLEALEALEALGLVKESDCGQLVGDSVD